MRKNEIAITEINIESKFICNNDRNKFTCSMTQFAVYEWVNSKNGCRIMDLCKRLQYQDGENCGECDNCIVKEKSLPQNRISIMQAYTEEANKITKSNAINARFLLDELQRICLLCKKSYCIGTCKRIQGAQCFKCGGNHLSRKCHENYKDPLRNKACYSCFEYWTNNEITHHPKDCLMKDKLKALFINRYRDELKKNIVKISFATFVKTHFINRDSYCKVVA